MDADATYDDVMAWFGTGHHAGRFDLHGLSLLLDNTVLNKPVDVWNYVLDHRLLVLGSQEFWVTPKGKVWNVDFAMHEIILSYAMDGALEITEVEKGGWLRVSKGHALHRTKLTRIQQETCARLRPDLLPRLSFNEEIRKVPLKTPFDCSPKDWSVWVPDVDARG